MEIVRLIDTLKGNLITTLLNQYLLTVKEVREDRRKTSEARREKLQKLLTPIIYLYRAYFIGFPGYKDTEPLYNPKRLNIYIQPEDLGEKPICFTSLYPFVDLTIDLENELDISKLKYDRDKYYIPNKRLLNDRWSVREIWHSAVTITREETETVIDRPVRVRVTETVLPEGRYSLWDLYNWWLPSLDKNKIKSKDLLDQILVTYTIKMALNGDEKAINRLHSLYEDTAIGIAINLAKRRGYKDIGKDELKSVASTLLHLIITGFRPEDILSELLKDRRSDIFPIPLWVEKFYLWYYTEYAPKHITLEVSPSGEAFIELPTMLLHPYTPVKDKTAWQGTPKRVMRFNSFVYKPHKRANLTLWLFGTKGNPMQGKFCQMLSNILNFPDKVEDEDMEDRNIGIALKKRLRQTTESNLDDTTIRRAIDELLKKGVSRRDADIFIKCKVLKTPQREITKQYNLSRMHIYRICKKIATSL